MITGHRLRLASWSTLCSYPRRCHRMHTFWRWNQPVDTWRKKNWLKRVRFTGLFIDRYRYKSFLYNDLKQWNYAKIPIPSRSIVCAWTKNQFGWTFCVRSTKYLKLFTTRLNKLILKRLDIATILYRNDR